MALNPNLRLLLQPKTLDKSPEELISLRTLSLSLAMEGLEMEESPHDQSPDLCNSILSRFSRSPNESHQHLCAAIGAISQELKDQNIPLTPMAYFCATCSSLDRLAADPEPPSHIVDALLTILSMVLPRISGPVLREKADYLSGLLERVVVSISINPGAAGSGLKCISILLSSRSNRVSWSDVSKLFGILLGFVTDDRPKVRRQAHLCLRDVVQCFRETSLLAPASDTITNTFERFLLLAGGSNTSASEGPTGAQEVLYILDALKECLPLIPMKFSTNIMKYFKSLLELNQPIVTKRITDALYFLCLQPSVEVSSELLLDLLCSLAISVSANETSGDSMAFTARLLDVGMNKLFTLNRQNCVIKLPVILSAFRDILASDHEEPLHVAMEGFKSLINTCIDENLIKQGVDQIKANSGMEPLRTAPTIIEKVSAIVESLLDYRYATVWDLSFQIVATMFSKLGGYSHDFMKGTLHSLADMEKLPDEDFPYRKQLHECVGYAIVAMGPASFLSVIPLKLDAEKLSGANVWLFPILKQYTIGAHLSYFTENILSMIKLVRQKSALLEQEGRIQSARSIDGVVYSLWSLLPSFCNYPQDTAENFKYLERVLCSSLREDTDIRGLICSSLQILVQQNKDALEGKDALSGKEVSICERQAIARYTPEVATDNLNVLRSSAREVLSVLSGIFLKSSKDDGGSLQNTISLFASISDKGVVSRFFKNTMKKLLKVTQDAGKAQNSKISNSMEIDNSSSESSLSLARAQLFDLAVSLLPGLDSNEIDLLFVAVQPALKDDEGLIQKKAYKVLSIVLKNSDGLISRKLEELLSLMFEVMPSCHFSAKRHRLNCLYYLIVHVSKDESEQRRRDIISSFLTEIVLALKEVNKKTRNKAYDILVQIGHACGDEEKGGRKENLHLFFNMVAGGLAGDSPHMISAAVKGLARLTYEFTDLVSMAYNILPHTFSHIRRKNRELIKANLGLLKVLVARSQADGLHTHLKSLVEGLLSWPDSTKNHFKAKVKLLLEMLVKKCGLEAVKAVMPEEHMKLLTNIRKIKERKEKKLAANTEETKSRQSKATTSRMSRWNHTRIFSDFDDDDETDNGDEEYMDTKTVSSRHMKGSSMHKAATLRSKRIHNKDRRLPDDMFDQLEDEPLDLLDRQKTRSALRSSENLKRKKETDDEPEIDSDGRLIIREEGNNSKGGDTTASEPDSEVKSRAESRFSMNSHKGALKRRKTSDSKYTYSGSEYSSKKAGGDLKKKDKLEPYAYWQLDRKMMSKRPEQRAAARKGMASVVNVTKRLEGKSVSHALSMKKTKSKVKKKSSHKKNK